MGGGGACWGKWLFFGSIGHLQVFWGVTFKPTLFYFLGSIKILGILGGGGGVGVGRGEGGRGIVRTGVRTFC